MVLLTGCAEKQQANETLPSSSAAPTTEALPPMGPADFPVPEEARTQDAVGAEAFLRYWIDLLNHQQGIPAGQPLRDLGPECHECLRIARVYDEAAAADQHYEGGQLVAVELAPPVFAGEEAAVSFIATEAAVRLADDSGIVIESSDAASALSSGLTLIWSDTDRCWHVSSMTLG